MTALIYLFALVCIIGAVMWLWKPELMTKAMAWIGGVASVLASALASFDYSLLAPYVKDPKTLGIVGAILLTIAVARHIRAPEA